MRQLKTVSKGGYLAEENKKPKILIVDDEERNLKLMGLILQKHGYEYDTAVNGREAVEKAEKISPDLIYLDIMMPVMNGYEACKRLRGNPLTEHIPVVMITALREKDSMIRGLEIGADDFIVKPVEPVELALRTKNLLKVKKFQDFLRHHNELLDAEVKKKTENLRAALDELKESQDKLKEGYLGTIYRLTKVAEYKDEETASHIRRVSLYCNLFAKHLGWPEDDIETITYASPMHDIGKVGLPAEILLKPGRLNPEEFALLKTHSTIGGRILSGSSSGFLQMAERIALTHHERWDGGGYPNGLKEEEIPVEGRIMNISDQYDAMRGSRPYKPHFDHEKTFNIITVGDGRTMPEHFDPKLLELFKDIHKELEAIYEEHKD